MSTLKLYWVGDMDIYAANSSEEALRLGNEMCGGDEPVFQEADVTEIADDDLDKPFPEYDENEQPTGKTTTMRAWLNAATAPGWIAGTE